MITAERARELHKLSDASINQHLNAISNQIEKAATLGKREILLDYVLGDAFKTPANRLTDFQKLVCDRIGAVGFTVSIKKIHHDTPGFRVDPDEFKSYDTFHIQVSW